MFDNYNVNSLDGGLFDVYIVSVDVDQIDLNKEKSKATNPHSVRPNSANRRSSNLQTKTVNSGCLQVRLNMCAKVNDPVKYFSNIENMDVKICAMQVIDADVRKKITANPISYVQTSSGEINSKFVKTKIVSLFDSMTSEISKFTGISRRNYAANGNAKSAFNQLPPIPYTKKIDSNGLEYYEIPIKVEFVIEEEQGGASIQDLSYFCYSFIDQREKYFDRRKERKTNVKSYKNTLFVKSNSIGNIKSEIIIKNGKLENKSRIFTDNSGKVWTGAVHKMQDGKYMKGKFHNRSTRNEEYLQSTEITNIKIRDNRIYRSILERRIDIAFLSNSQSYNPLSQQNAPVFSDIYLTRDKTGAVRYMFSFNAEEAVKQCTIYPNFVTNLKRVNPRAYSQMIQSAIVTDLVVSRKRIKDVSGDLSEIRQFRHSNSDLKNSNSFAVEDKQRVVHAGARSSSDLQRSTTTIVPRNEGSLDFEGKLSGNIRELTNVKSSNSLEIRHYSGLDLDIISADRGIFQYSVELTLKDPIDAILSTYISNLRNILGETGDNNSGGINLISYISDIESRPQYYDSYLERFKPEFIRYYNSRYVSNGQYSFILEAIRNYVSILFTFIDSRTFKYSPTEVANYLCLICSPNTGGPQGITVFANLVSSLISQLSKMISNQNYTKAKLGEGRASNDRKNIVKNKEQKTNQFVKNFSNLYNSSDPSNVGFDYLFLSSTKAESNRDCLTKITKKDMKNRFTAEVNKFFKSGVSREDILITNNNGDALNPNDRLENTKYTYLSPSNIFLANSEKSNAFANTSCELSSQDAQMLNKVLNGIIAYNNGKENDRLAPFQQESDRDYITAMIQKGISEGMSEEEISQLKKELAEIAKKEAKLAGQGDVPAGDRPDEGSNTTIGAMATAQSSKKVGDKERFFEMISNVSDGGMLDECNNIDNFLFNDRTGTTASYYINQLVKSVCEDNSQTKVPPLNMAPIHLKALMLAINGSNSIKSNPVFASANSNSDANRSLELLKNPSTYGFFQINYKLLKQVQVFRGYKTEDQRTYVANPIWSPMSTSDLDTLKNGNLVCKLANMTDVERCVDSNKKLNLPLYNDIFIITAGSGNENTSIGGKYLFDGPFDFASNLYGGKFMDDMVGVINLFDQKKVFTDKMSCGASESPISSEAAFGPILGAIPLNTNIPSQSSDTVDTEGMSTSKFFDHVAKMGFADILPDKFKNNPKYKTPSMKYMNNQGTSNGTQATITAGPVGSTSGGGSNY
jgi:hypothetical protein